MRLCVAVLLFLVLYGLSGFIRAEGVYEAAEGGNITVGCQFYINGHTKIFCKNNCDKEENILVKTSENERCEGRYCIKYEYKGLWNRYIMYVNITNVTKADTGRYQCVLERIYIIDGNHEFRIKVTKNAALNPTYTLQPEPTVTVKPTTDMDLTVQTVSRFLLLLTLIPVVLITLCALVFYRKRKVQNENEANDEVVMNENCPAPPSEPADSTYQSLSADTRDHTHIYSSLHPQPPPSSNTAPC
ncbi:uncharacterized protein LOC129412444 [Boleophthalmus pectinirostris]|uniref:uncharacterized protein LOC129412444 n=1 Tax=Boleophthalmus pectinirostris TaxID=150288 RepID=UPI002432D44E|nr:uncharacterized protein LOC129412444 [Boleophthalmus pectinirostris]